MNDSVHIALYRFIRCCYFCCSMTWICVYMFAVFFIFRFIMLEDKPSKRYFKRVTNYRLSIKSLIDSAINKTSISRGREFSVILYTHWFVRADSYANNLLYIFCISRCARLLLSDCLLTQNLIRFEETAWFYFYTFKSKL